MTGVLMLENMNRGNTLKQGDLSVLKYRLHDADDDTLDVSGKPATVRLMKKGFTFIAYEKEGLVVASDNTISFNINKVIPGGTYYLDIIVDDQYVFPSRYEEGKFNVDRSSLGSELNIIEDGKEGLILEVKEQVKTELAPFLGGVGEVELYNYATKDYVDTAVSDVQAPDLSNYVLSSRVLTDVPANAKFTDTTYTAGTGINISGDVISATGGGEGGYDDTSVVNHMNDRTNPHDVTKSQVGLGNVDNTSDANKPVSTAVQSALNNKADNSELHEHVNNTNIHREVIVSDTPPSDTNVIWVDPNHDGDDDTNVVNHMNDQTNPHDVTKSQVGLGNVDNTSDANKPVSTAVQSALNNKADKSQVLTNVPANAKFTDTTYSAGTGINITGDVISATGDGFDYVERSEYIQTVMKTQAEYDSLVPDSNTLYYIIED